eukprot:1077170-Prymnesium_polylepis.1
MVASGMFLGCYATDFENAVCVCTRYTGDLLTTKSACVSYERQRQACARPAKSAERPIGCPTCEAATNLVMTMT